MKLKTKRRFKELCRKQTPEERKELEASIEELGWIRDPIVTTQDHVIVDGHNRYEIATKHGLDFDIFEMEFESDDEAELWILRNQLARRNLTPAEFKLALGRLYNSEKKAAHRPKVHQNEGVNSPGETAEKVADESGVSRATVERAGSRAKAYDSLTKPAQKLVDQDPAKVTDQAIKKLASLGSDEQQAVARKVRTGQETLPDALGLNNGKQDDPVKLALSKARKTAEALLRALDDLHELKPNATRKTSSMRNAKAVLEELKRW